MLSLSHWWLCRQVLPTPSFNIINGGVHAGNELAIQEFMILPTGATRFSEGLRWATEVYHSLKSILKERYGIDAVNVGDEGGFAPPVNTADEALDLVEQAIEVSRREQTGCEAVDLSDACRWLS